MVSELHKMGYQCLRIMPYMHPLAWRLAVGPRGCFSKANTANLSGEQLSTLPVFSSAGSYFDWSDADPDNARALAEKFVSRFPDVANRGLGRDWAYAGWLSELLGVLERGDFLPVIEWENMKGNRDQLLFLPIWSFEGSTDVNMRFDEDANGWEAAEGVRKFPLPPAVTDSDVNWVAGSSPSLPSKARPI